MARGKIPARKNPFQSSLIGGASQSLTAEAANAITATIQLKDWNNNALGKRVAVKAYLASNANGSAIAAAPDGGVANGANGFIIQPVASLFFQLISGADGKIDLTLTESTAKSFWLVLVLGDNTLLVLPAITFV